MRAIAIFGLALLGSAAFAQEGMYVGVGLGSFDYAEDSAFLAPEPFDDTVSAWKIYGGFEVNEHLAFEIRYGATDDFTQTFSETDPVAGEITGTIGIDFTTTSAVAVGMLPRDWGALFAGLGYFDQNVDANLEGMTECCGPISGSASFGDEGMMAVLGVEWRFGRFGTGVGIRVEYEWLDVEDASGSTVGIGVAYRF
jgi:hypothetical protein